MEFGGLYFFTEELDDLILAKSQVPVISPRLRDRCPDEGEPLEGETLPDSAFGAIRTWLGI
jgi:hypothetical protein